MRRIVIDLDGVLVDFDHPFREVLQAQGAAVPPIPPEGPATWGWYYEHATRAQVSAAWDYVNSTPAWWGQLPAHRDLTPKALEYLALLNFQGDDEVTFVTSRAAGRNAAAAWLAKQGVLGPLHVVLTPGGKAPALLAMQPHVIIEDKLKTLQEVVALKLPKCECILVDRPYNREGRSGFPLAIADNTEKALEKALEEALYQNRAGAVR